MYCLVFELYACNRDNLSAGLSKYHQQQYKNVRESRLIVNYSAIDPAIDISLFETSQFF